MITEFKMPLKEHESLHLAGGSKFIGYIGKIENVEVEELVIINKKIYITNSMNIYIGCHKNYKNKEIIRNEEDYKVLRKV